MSRGWIGVDLDGTLAYYTEWKGVQHIGAPIPKMLNRVKMWLQNGQDVRIFTARVCRTGAEREEALLHINAWCNQHLGVVLPVTNEKDFSMIELWDDRCVQVEKNTGRLMHEVCT